MSFINTEDTIISVSGVTLLKIKIVEMTSKSTNSLIYKPDQTSNYNFNCFALNQHIKQFTLPAHELNIISTIKRSKTLNDHQ